MVRKSTIFEKMHTIGKYWIIPKSLKAILKSNDAVQLLMELTYLHNEFCDKPEFTGELYRSRRSIEESTLLTIREQRTAEKLLVEKGFLTIVVKGCPPINHFKLNIEFTENAIKKENFDYAIKANQFVTVSTPKGNIEISNSEPTCVDSSLLRQSRLMGPSAPEESLEEKQARLRNLAKTAKPTPAPVSKAIANKMIRPETIAIIEYWNAKGTLKQQTLVKSPRGAIRYCEQRKYIRNLDNMIPAIMNGTFYTSFDDMDQKNLKTFAFKISHLKTAIDRFARMATFEYNNDPEKVKSIDMPKFFHNERAFLIKQKADGTINKNRFEYKYAFIHYMLNDVVPLSEKNSVQTKSENAGIVRSVIKMLRDHNGYTDSTQNYNRVAKEVDKAVASVQAVANGNSFRILESLPKHLSMCMGGKVHLDNLYKAVEFQLIPMLREHREIHA